MFESLEAFLQKLTDELDGLYVIYGSQDDKPAMELARAGIIRITACFPDCYKVQLFG